MNEKAFGLVIRGALAVLVVFGLALQVQAIDKKDADERMSNCIEVLGEIIHIPEGGIPKNVLTNCKGLIVVPHVVKAALGVGGSRGHGIVVHRLAGGAWSDPSFCTITAGGIGFQIGGQATDLILVVNNEKGFKALLGNNFKFGANASVAAGPVGRTAEAGTDVTLRAEIYSYSRSKGLFGGISVEGAGFTMDDKANTAFYGKPVDAEKILYAVSKPYPAAAQPLLKLLSPYKPKK